MKTSLRLVRSPQSEDWNWVFLWAHVLKRSADGGGFRELWISPSGKGSSPSATPDL